jgi:glycosyltransferase involved in cell wall biosynthesis
MHETARPCVLHVTNIPTPYRLPQYRAFARALAAEAFDLTVYFIGTGKRPRYWKIDDEEFEGIEAIYGTQGASIPLRTLGITRSIDRLRPAVVVLAWAMDPTALLVLWHCRARGIPCIIYTGETDDAAAQRSFPAAREAFRRLFLRRADGFVVYGASAERYLVNRGVEPSRIATAINVVDTEFFRRSVDEIRAEGAHVALRAAYRTRDELEYAMHLLFVGELLELKGLPLLLEALAATGRRDIALHLVGSGPQEAELRELADRLGIAHDLYFHGYRQRPELPSFYAFANVLVFPSLKDVFGLVMVEGAAAGLPVIGSNLSGGTIDIVLPGETGVIIDPRDCQSFAEAITMLADDPALCRKMGRASMRHVLTNLTPERSAAGYVEALLRLVRR